MQMPSAQQNWKGGVTCERAVIISKEYEEKFQANGGMFSKKKLFMR